MTGKYVECDWCGNQQLGDSIKGIRKSNKFITKTINGFNYDLCSKGCETECRREIKERINN